MLSSTRRNDLRVIEGESKHIRSNNSIDEALPFDGRLSSLLGLDADGQIGAILRDALISPVNELISNHGKKIRGTLVNLAFRLLNHEPRSSVVSARGIRVGAQVLELIHAGSLIVDDIEDGSQMRRGRPALHVRHGVPLALNAGNWLYFWPFQLVADIGLPRETTLAAYEAYQRTLLRAHFGQALDLGTRVDSLDQDCVSEICLASLALKTGALTGFAMVLGGLIAGADETTASLLDDFGRELGVALQMFDDIGNVTGAREPAKQYEDFLLCRPSFAWAWAAANSSPKDYCRFVDAVAKLPDPNEIEEWLSKHDLVGAGRASATRHMEQAFAKLIADLDGRRITWSRCAYDELRGLGEEIASAYE
jgi:geranylgeranyl pyrophosphate synthase